MADEPSRSGRTFEDIQPGEIYRHPIGRTLTETDNTWFTLLTLNPNPIHFDRHFAAQTEWGRPLVDSTLTLALVTGLSVAGISPYAVNLGWNDVRLTAPVFEGDTIYAETQVMSARESKSRPNMGVVVVRTTGFNQNGVVVIEFERVLLVYKRDYLPQNPRPESHQRPHPQREGEGAP